MKRKVINIDLKKKPFKNQGAIINGFPTYFKDLIKAHYKTSISEFIRRVTLEKLEKDRLIYTRRDGTISIYRSYCPEAFEKIESREVKNED